MTIRKAAVAVPAIAGVLLWLFNYCAPLEPTSVAVYAGLALVLAGATSLAFRWRVGGLVIVAGLLIAAAGLLWPVRSTRIHHVADRLDSVLPEYEFSEVHTVRVHATPERAAEELRKVTFDDLRVYDTLMRVRAMASGASYKKGPLGDRRILDVLAKRGSGFLPLYDDGREIVMGMAGQPWARGRKPMADRQAFDSFCEPCSVKIAFNLTVGDEGAGWSRVTTVTRVKAIDDCARRTMAKYWRVIYPGTGLIRRMWLNAVRDRAEA